MLIGKIDVDISEKNTHSQQKISMTAVTSTTVKLLLLSQAAFVSAWTTIPQKKSSFSNTARQMAADEFFVGVLGDLHIDPRKMEDYETGREQWMPLFDGAKSEHGNVAMVSLGDLGESKNCDHNPENPSELFAGTSLCHEIASEFLGSFGVPYEVVGGNHDLEGLDEFETDAENLEVYLKAHGKETAHFKRQIAEKTLLVGLGSTVFRDAKYTSHEVTVDDEQIAWFEQTLKDHPSTEGWKIFVFTHAPPNGSGLRVLQENHVVNGCCWLNHSDDKKCRNFIELVREHRCVKAWFSGHFHLGQDYQDSITFPTIPKEVGPYPNRGSCVFVQTSVMRGGTSRDGRQQSRVIRGNKEGFEICTVDHQKGGEIRVDATVTYTDDNHEVGVYAHEDDTRDGDEHFKVYAPCAGDDYHPPDEGYVGYSADGQLNINFEITEDSKAWWYMADGRVLGFLKGMLIEYDPSTLAPLGLVMGADELCGKKIAVVDSGIDEECFFSEEEGMDGYDCAAGPEREQAVVVYDKEGIATVIQPNEDGSYWRKIVRNKMIRMKENRRIKAAMQFVSETYGVDDATAKERVVSSWGPYISTVGTAKKTGVAGLTAPAQK